MNKKFGLIALLITFLFVLSGCSAIDTTAPISGFKEFTDIFVYPMAAIFWLIGNTIGFGNYGITIILATIIVRTMAWPIYAKTNDMSLKMQIVQPEMDKLNRKYEGKDDRESQQRKSMEMMQLYKKYGLGLGGCLAPIIQFPIFIGFYRAISRMPASIVKEGNWLHGVFSSTKIFGIDMTLGKADQLVAIIVLAALVGITQIGSQILMQNRQKKQKEAQTSSIPAYRRPQQTDQQRQTELMMKIMLYGMSIMMVVFVYNSPAGLGVYWFIGNIYSSLQSYIGFKNSNKRIEKLKLKHNK